MNPGLMTSLFLYSMCYVCISKANYTIVFQELLNLSDFP